MPPLPRHRLTAAPERPAPPSTRLSIVREQGSDDGDRPRIRPAVPRWFAPDGSVVRALVVDDDLPCAGLLRDLLALEGADAVSCDSGEAALPILAEHEPHVAIFDVCLPGMTGLRLAEATRRLCGSDVLMVAVSGRTDGLVHQAAEEAGFQRRFAKPLDVPELMEYLRQGVSRL